MTQHTPGPWVVNPSQLDQIATAAAKQEIAWATGLNDQHETIANARLIAAAPDLLDVLKLCDGNIDSLLASNHPLVFGEWLAVVRAAISKATGEK